jgi:hypothetical protein
METKTCTKCKVEQDINNFYVRRSRNNQPKSICKKCESIQKAKPIEVVPDLEGEIWKDIAGFEGIYVVSNMGRVKRIMHRKNPTNTIMNTTLNGGGYHHLMLTVNGKGHSKILSILVATAFIPNPENKPQVNHLNGKDDNRAESLEWNTSKENIRHAWDNGLSKPKLGTLNGNAVLTEKEVLEIRAIEGMTKRDIGKLYNIGEAAVGKIINRQRWCHI